MTDRLPVFIDLETRSCCDLRARGGWAYASDPSTRLLTVAWRVDGVDHVWMPGADESNGPFAAAHLAGVVVHHGPGLPEALPLDRPWAAHNCDTFDALVWRGLGLPEPPEWIDTYPMALSVGMPGGINAIGELLWGKGKYLADKKEMLKASKAKSPAEADPRNVPLGQQYLVARYNVQDVRLLAGLWPVLVRERVVTPHEQAVLVAHKAVNDRGVRVDRGLVHALIALDDHAKADAVRKIAALTGGKLADQTALQSKSAMTAWLTHMGIDMGATTATGQPSLARKVVENWIKQNRDQGDVGEPEGLDEDDEWDVAPPPKDMATVIRVLELRASALRITGGKLHAALESLGEDDHVRGLHTFHAAHTGRWAARRIQTHNLPRPKKGVPVWKLVDLYERTGGLDYDAVCAMCDPNDAASGLLRSLFFVGADADLSQIEARVLAWLAGEKWLMDTYWADEDAYIKMAECICGPKDKWTQPNDNRQIFGKVPSLACGYGGGPKCLAIYAATFGVNMQDNGVTEDECVFAWRRLHKAIAGEEAGRVKGRPYFRGGLWDKYSEAASKAVRDGTPSDVGPVSFAKVGNHLVVTLPSGRRMTYRNVRIVDRPYFGKTQQAVEYAHPRYGRKATYGGALVENVTQAVARDVMAAGIVLCEASGVPVCLHVHDSVATPREDRFEELMRCVSTPPDWLKNFPLDAKGAALPRWAKDPPPGVEEQTWRNGVRHK